MERAQRPLVAIAHVRSDPLRRVVRSRDPELDPQGIELRERPVGQELERPCRDPSTARFRGNDVAELELPSFEIDAEREREPKERPAPIDDRESAIVAFLAPGGYTVIVGGKDGATGVALVEAYRIP